MSIKIRYFGKRDRKAKLAIDNLQFLLSELPVPHQLLLNELGVYFEFHRSATESGSSNYFSRSIALEPKEFVQFSYQCCRKPSANQRWVLATLKEEVIHLLDSHFRWTHKRQWKKAARADLTAGNARMQALCAAQRDYDSSKMWEKLSPEEYMADLSLAEKFIHRLFGYSEAASELLPNLLLVRDYLDFTGTSPAKIERALCDAFPHTYELAMGFEARIREEAIRRATLRRPELAADPEAAMLMVVHESRCTKSATRGTR